MRLNKVLGLAIGEKSLLAAEITAGERPEVKRLAELVYPEGVSAQTPGELGTAPGDFLRDQKFTAKSAVFGLPARWLVVKAKEVPPADSTTLANLLRLQAEGEFSSELKDLVYDYTADTSAGNPKSVLLIATSQKYIDGINTLCDAAKISPVMVTSSAIALGVVTGRSEGASNPLVLLVSPTGAELTAQSGDSSNGIRHMRGPAPDRPFTGELRRAISGMPPATGTATNGAPRELVLWDAAEGSDFDSSTLGATLGMPIRLGDLPILGVEASGDESNGQGRKYAAAVALGMLALVDKPAPVDFLHSRLAPPKPPLVPLWVIAASLSVIALIGLIFGASTYLEHKRSDRDKLDAYNNSFQDQVKQDRSFVTKVSFAQAWHLGNPRYLPCMADLTQAVPADGQTYALSLSLHEVTPPTNNSVAAGTASIQSVAVRDLAGVLEAKTTDQRRVLQVLNNMKTMSRVFSEVKLQDLARPGNQESRGFLHHHLYLYARKGKALRRKRVFHDAFKAGKKHRVGTGGHRPSGGVIRSGVVPLLRRSVGDQQGLHRCVVGKGG